MKHIFRSDSFSLLWHHWPQCVQSFTFCVTLAVFCRPGWNSIPFTRLHITSSNKLPSASSSTPHCCLAWSGTLHIQRFDRFDCTDTVNMTSLFSTELLYSWTELIFDALLYSHWTESTLTELTSAEQWHSCLFRTAELNSVYIIESLISCLFL